MMNWVWGCFRGLLFSNNSGPCFQTTQSGVRHVLLGPLMHQSETTSQTCFDFCLDVFCVRGILDPTCHRPIPIPLLCIPVLGTIGWWPGAERTQRTEVAWQIHFRCFCVLFATLSNATGGCQHGANNHGQCYCNMFVGGGRAAQQIVAGLCKIIHMFLLRDGL